MAYTQAYSAYKETGVKTASQGKLLLMLYEEALRRLDTAISLFTNEEKIEAASIEKFHNNLVKAQEIITELMVSLDMEKGGEIARNLMALYSFFNRELMDICINHSREKLHSVRTMMNELFGSWSIAVTETPSADPSAHPALDING
ncbi:flagellar export chaperone FliS [Treponema sp. OMZ 840]|uniref:flagellar export chaperone FliS n=1 Tax=Treponema sp. OMZ 840 TaxID=244313 RepID=UPI003D8A36FE